MAEGSKTFPLVFAPAAVASGGPRRPEAGRLARLGDWMARHRRAILVLQWIIVIFYAVLVVLPAFLPHPNPEARLFSSDFGASSSVDPELCVTPGRMPLLDKTPTVAAWHERLVLLAQYLFWGVWWPFVILSIMFMGRFWCGVLCPEGALAEFASRRGLRWRIPRWLRWSGWPVVAFILTTVYGQLISVYEYPQAALLILGGSTVAAVAIGYVYGKGKRVWCRYLCPVSGVFALLARLAPIHFKVDREAWNRHPQRTQAVDCAPLLNVSRLDSMAECHACGRCSGHRDAVSLSLRSPNAEILQTPEPPATSEVILLLFGILGVAVGAFQWTVSPWFVAAKTAAATWLVEHEMFWALEESPAWWLLTRQPEAQDIFTWLDGLAILTYIGAVALLVGGFATLCLRLAARIGGTDWRRLALGLAPLGGLGLFLGLSMMTINHLRSEGILLAWLPWARGALLAVAVFWCLRLGFGLLQGARLPGRLLALSVFAAPVAAVAGLWATLFYVW